MDGSCKAYGESLLHSKKQVEHERLRLAKTVGRLTNSYKGTYKRRQTHRFCSCIDGPLKAPPLTLFHYMRTRPVVNNCILTPSFTFQPRSTRPFSRACAYLLARALIFQGTRLSGSLLPFGYVTLHDVMHSSACNQTLARARSWVWLRQTTVQGAKTIHF